MRIAIVNLTGGGMSGGYRKYLFNIVPIMAGDPGVESILCLSPSKLQIGWLNNLNKVRFDACEPYSLLSPGMDRGLKEKLGLFAPDVVFIPMERYINYNGVPVVNMVRNMLPYFYQPHNPPLERIRYFVQRVIAKRAVMKAERVIAVSEYVREFIRDHWNIGAEKIGVVYHGHNCNNSHDDIRPAAMPEGWDNQFLFTAGSIDPYRGLEDLLTALSLCRETNATELNLVIAGEARKVMAHYKDRLMQAVKHLGLKEHVKWAGYLNEREMSWCYRHCTAFVMTSRVEACPNVAIEAMGNGCICISTDNRPMPEFFRDSALYYRAGQAESLVDSLFRAISLNKEEREQLSKGAVNRALDFPWKMCAEKTIRELKKALNR
jgi:glycosyltransferase involved in cell wall biosynthesis